ncbi:MAG TPA: 50S ribosomal protein L29 [Bryobacteraceae bacterium]|jgi:large subunit ribosomal protein L29
MKENAEKFRALDPAELDKQLRDGTEQMFRLRFQMSMGQMDGVKKVRSLRKERARILTVLKQRGVTPSPAAAAPLPLVTKVTAKGVPGKRAAAKPAAGKGAAKTAPKKAVKGKKGE